MHVLVINSGSSSIKFCVYAMEQESLLISGRVERIGEQQTACQFRKHTDHSPTVTQTESREIKDHATGIQYIFQRLQENGIPGATAPLHAIGHRVVHGGSRYTCPMLIDPNILQGIRETIPLAPLHNPANLAGIETAGRLLPEIPQVAVFDTAFFQTLPPHASHYALPMDLARKHHIRRYGFHGISHEYVARQAAGMLQQDFSSLRIISLHLGNGASAAAIHKGVCIDTSMGMTPLAGLVMGTRCGDLDPGVPIYLARTLGMEADELEALLNRDSGMLGLCGSSDMRDIHKLAAQGQEQARLALDIYRYRIITYCGAYYTALGGLDALVFTAGIGENDAQLRETICQQLAPLGIVLDAAKNHTAAGNPSVISHPDSQVSILVVPTNEELAIARHTVATLNQSGSA